MKVLVVLALATFTGCHANLFYADEPKPQLEVWTDAFWDYVAKATETAYDTLQMITKSQLGQHINARLTESADVASQYAVTLQERLPPMAQELMTKITTETADVASHYAVTLQEHLELYAWLMKDQVQQMVEHLSEELVVALHCKKGFAQ